jgi:Fe-Mn family superoxide dismutase
MKTNKVYVLPELPYGYGDLTPFLTRRQLKIHHQKHHQGYVNAANALLEKLKKARKKKVDLDMKATLKALSFNIGGHILHSLFWPNLAPVGKGGRGPKGALATSIKSEFGHLRRLKKEFTQAAVSVEGSGWAALSFCDQTQKLLVTQIEKHHLHLYPNFKIIMVLDVWEHAYYLDYQNERGRFVEVFWSVVDWHEVNRRFEELM